MNNLLKFFKYEHLPPGLQLLSKACCDLAVEMEAKLPDCAEKTAGLRKLLEAKDCFVRAALDDGPKKTPVQEAAEKGYNDAMEGKR